MHEPSPWGGRRGGGRTGEAPCAGRNLPADSGQGEKNRKRWTVAKGRAPVDRVFVGDRWKWKVMISGVLLGYFQKYENGPKNIQNEMAPKKMAPKYPTSCWYLFCSLILWVPRNSPRQWTQNESAKGGHDLRIEKGMMDRQDTPGPLPEGDLPDELLWAEGCTQKKVILWPLWMETGLKNPTKPLNLPESWWYLGVDQNFAPKTYESGTGIFCVGYIHFQLHFWEPKNRPNQGRFPVQELFRTFRNPSLTTCAEN